MKQTLVNIKKELKNHETVLRNDFQVQKIGIFGSYVRGENSPSSDIDILVSFSALPGFFKFIKLEEKLSKLLKRKVDLVTEQALKNAVKDDILRETSYV